MLRLIRKVKASQAAIVASLALLATEAFAQAGGGGSGITSQITKAAKGDIGTIVTAALGIYTILEISRRYQDIFEGKEIMKNVAVIGAWLALTAWWQKVLDFVVNFTL